MKLLLFIFMFLFLVTCVFSYDLNIFYSSVFSGIDNSSETLIVNFNDSLVLGSGVDNFFNFGLAGVDLVLDLNNSKGILNDSISVESGLGVFYVNVTKYSDYYFRLT